jgi:hypothetical protein
MSYQHRDCMFKDSLDISKEICNPGTACSPVTTIRESSLRRKLTQRIRKTGP